MEYTYDVTLNLNARFQPMHRAGLEDALLEVLEKMELGTVDGGGTMMMPTGEIEFCDIEIMLKDGSQESIDKLREIVESFGVPKGSRLLHGDNEVGVGSLEGLALYLKGSGLPEEVYRNCDINYVIEKMNELMNDTGSMYSFWEGPDETALYFYGGNFAVMSERVQGFIDEYPLCSGCRVEQIA